MELRDFDGKCVRITDQDGDAYDGICKYVDADENGLKRGRTEESLQILSYAFFKSDIKNVESLEDHEGPYGRFLDSYGKLEEMAVREGIGSIIDVLFCDEKEHVHRMLHCLDKHFDPLYGYKFDCRQETIGALCALSEITKDEYVKVAADRLITIWGKPGSKPGIMRDGTQDKRSGKHKKKGKLHG